MRKTIRKHGPKSAESELLKSIFGDILDSSDTTKSTSRKSGHSREQLRRLAAAIIAAYQLCDLSALIEKYCPVKLERDDVEYEV